MIIKKIKNILESHDDDFDNLPEHIKDLIYKEVGVVRVETLYHIKEVGDNQ